MGFETYVPQRGPSSGKSNIRILKNGDFSISPAVYDEWFQKAGYVELLFDPRAKRIGLKPRPKATKATYKIRSSPQGGRRYYVSGRQFLESYGIKTGRSRSFEASWNGRQKLVEFPVK